jgi:hypothetical protein
LQKITLIQENRETVCCTILVHLFVFKCDKTAYISIFDSTPDAKPKKSDYMVLY